jgi:prepilin-type N-terminal cleavage/methylation domain-containing protein
MNRRKEMKRLKNQEGFTLIELVIIILVLGILAATAIPKFYDLTAKAKEAAEKGVVGGVRGGIAIAYASNLVNGSTNFPGALGGTAPGTASAGNPFFGNVLAPGITDGTWTLTGAVYTGPGGGTYQYSSVSGTFQ